MRQIVSDTAGPLQCWLRRLRLECQQVNDGWRVGGFKGDHLEKGSVRGMHLTLTVVGPCGLRHQHASLVRSLLRTVLSGAWTKAYS